MATQGESLVRKTQKGLSVLAFETTKQGRILKKRMRVAALQKEVRADLRDLGSLVYNALVNDQTGILEEEEIKLLVESIQRNKAEIEHLRDAIARISRVRKHFEEGDQAGDPAAAAMAEPQAETTPAPAEPPEAGEEAAKEAAGAEAAAPEAEAPKPKRAPRKRSTSRTTKKAEDEAADDGPKKSAPRKRAPRKKKAEPAVPPAPGTDPDHPEPPPSGDGDKS